MIHAAAPCPPEVKRQMIEWWGDAIKEYYAATEGGGTIVTAEEWLEQPGTVGRRGPARRSASSTTTATQLAAGEIGTVYMTHGRRRLRVQGRQGEDRRRTARDGFFTVGDIGYLDEDGYLFLCDRKTDMIISGGVNIYPAEIEGDAARRTRRSATSPCSASPTTTGARRSRRSSSRPRASSRRRRSTRRDPRASPTTNLGAVQAAASRSTSSTELPRDPNGKLYKRKLRDPYWEGASARSDRSSLALHLAV